MREIKFRAWIPNQKEMCPWANMSFTPGAFTDHGHDGPDHIHFADVFESFREQKIVLMQFTGLKDKNGKEIYEGDIVKTNSILSADEVLRVVFDRGCFSLSIKENPKLNEATCFRDAFSQAMDADKVLRMEVIGNIYENPELLKNEN